MNAPFETEAIKPVAFATGPITDSRKAYTAVEGRPDIAQPFREIALGGGTETP